MGCDHESCHCQTEVRIERNGRRYCSEHCASADTQRSDGCRCGHAGCSAAEELT
jgi:hypothetical protein